MAALLSPAPSVDRTAVPEARAVKLARDSAMVLATIAAADGTPRHVRFSPAELDAMAMLANHGLGWLRWQPRLVNDALRIDFSARVGDAWLNVAVGLTTAEDGGFPRIALRLGHVPVPERLIRLTADAIPALARRRGLAVPPAERLLSTFAVERTGVAATLAMPRSLLGLGRLILSADREAVDAALVRQIYGRLLAEELRGPIRHVDELLRLVFADDGQDADPIARNRAALIAATMFAVDPRARRLAEAGAGPPAPCRPDPPVVALAGRQDLAKHFMLSAALGATLGNDVTRAMGEWKELNDSLPGGSGFSFVDLAADRAGLALGRAAVQPGTAARIAAFLASADEARIFPSTALGLAEGISDREFVARFGAIDGSRYVDAVRRVDAMLAALPLFQEMEQPSTEG